MQVQIYHYSSRQPHVPCGVLRAPWSPSAKARPPLVVHCPHLAPRSGREHLTAVSPSLLQEQVLCPGSGSDSDEEEDEQDDSAGGRPSSDALLVVRRPFKEEGEAGTRREDVCVEEEEKEEEEAAAGGGVEGILPSTSSSTIDSGLNEFAKKMPMFEPLERVGAAQEGRPLAVNLELWLYRAKALARDFQFGEAEKILRKCISFWPEDGRGYVALGKILCKQTKFAEARSVYERGSQATQGENPYIWQCWAVLEKRMGNIRRARELFDAATVADKKHVAAWHGWAMLEIKQGNLNKARNLLGKGLKYCGANEYVYQTLALLEAKGKRIEQARFFFHQATLCNPKSCASWLAWAQMEMLQENNQAARQLFQKAVQASPKNRFAWHVWALFEAKQGDTDTGRKLLKIGHALNPRDPVILQSLALLEYKHSSANLARVLFRRASELDPKHQPVWIAWGWMEWKEGNISTARELYQRGLSIDSSSESAARCLQAWGVLEQRLGNLTAARRLFRSSLTINSQSFVTWMTWASLEEEQGNPIRAEEIRNLYLQQRTEVVDDASWVLGFTDFIDPAIDSIKRLLNLGQNSPPWFEKTTKIDVKGRSEDDGTNESSDRPRVFFEDGIWGSAESTGTSDFDLDAFVKDRLSLDVSELDYILERSGQRRVVASSRRVWRPGKRTASAKT